eukprot:CAMPEP_0197247048 /NCGR_PEP_ID=MMETSP1429-20130617/26068_1 /TAXON_ID=49237 /ORGANISM="Chaetoceros  sp., Strain UNC1202" /LENGTH=128 /DNA_ID=CAMNT_0042707855 /DNA_START=122 /DNA_END=504 /DNA_ORIENTATION=+
MVYITKYSSDVIYRYLEDTMSYTEDEWPVPNNDSRSYLTMLSADGLTLTIIHIIGNFGRSVFVDHSYWQSIIASKPASAFKGYLLGGLCRFVTPSYLATSSLGLASTDLVLPITAGEAGAGLVPPAVA